MFLKYINSVIMKNEAKFKFYCFKNPLNLVENERGLAMNVEKYL